MPRNEHRTPTTSDVPPSPPDPYPKAPSSRPIYGPGNSQPHKVCGKNGHFVDVHAVKAYTSTTCAATTQAKKPATNTTVTPTLTPSVTSTVTTTATATAAAASPAAGVKGVQQTPAAGAEAGPAGGAGALGALGTAAGGTLPFTGFPLWVVALAGLAAIATGLALLPRGRPAAAGAV